MKRISIPQQELELLGAYLRLEVELADDLASGQFGDVTQEATHTAEVTRSLTEKVGAGSPLELNDEELSIAIHCAHVGLGIANDEWGHPEEEVNEEVQQRFNEQYVTALRLTASLIGA